MAEERINEVLYAGAAGPVTLQLESWNRSLRSRAFRVSLRRAISTNRRWAHLSASSALKRQPTGADSCGRGVDELRHGRIVAVEEIRSRFEVVQSGGRALDVTLRPRREGDVDGGDGSDSITVIDEASGAPTLYLKLGRSTAAARTAAAGTAAAGTAAAPAVQRQTSSHRLLQKVLTDLFTAAGVKRRCSQPPPAAKGAEALEAVPRDGARPLPRRGQRARPDAPRRAARRGRPARDARGPSTCVPVL